MAPWLGAPQLADVRDSLRIFLGDLWLIGLNVV